MIEQKMNGMYSLQTSTVGSSSDVGSESANKSQNDTTTTGGPMDADDSWSNLDLSDLLLKDMPQAGGPTSTSTSCSNSITPPYQRCFSSEDNNERMKAARAEAMIKTAATAAPTKITVRRTRSDTETDRKVPTRRNTTCTASSSSNSSSSNRGPPFVVIEHKAKLVSSSSSSSPSRSTVLRTSRNDRRRSTSNKSRSPIRFVTKLLRSKTTPILCRSSKEKEKEEKEEKEEEEGRTAACTADDPQLVYRTVSFDKSLRVREFDGQESSLRQAIEGG